VSQREPALAGAGRRSIGRAKEPSGITKLAWLRAENARRDRLIARLRAIIALGERPIVELVLDLACRLDGLQLLEQLVECYAGLGPVVLRTIGGTGFAPAPLRVVGGRQ